MQGSLARVVKLREIFRNFIIMINDFQALVRLILLLEFASKGRWGIIGNFRLIKKVGEGILDWLHPYTRLKIY